MIPPLFKGTRKGPGNYFATLEGSAVFQARRTRTQRSRRLSLAANFAQLETKDQAVADNFPFSEAAPHNTVACVLNPSTDAWAPALLLEAALALIINHEIRPRRR